MAELELPDDEKELSHVAERDEVDAIIARVVETGGACDRADFHRVRVVVERYQEQSSLLDPHLESWIAPLAGVIRDQAHLGEDADMALVQRVSKVLHAFATVRGHKTVVRFFPHEAKDLEPAVALLTRSHGADALRPRDGRPPLGAEEIEEQALEEFGDSVMTRLDEHDLRVIEGSLTAKNTTEAATRQGMRCLHSRAPGMICPARAMRLRLQVDASRPLSLPVRMEMPWCLRLAGTPSAFLSVSKRRYTSRSLRASLSSDAVVHDRGTAGLHGIRPQVCI